MFDKPKRKLLAEGMGSFYIKWASGKDKEENPLHSKKSGQRMIKVCCNVTDSRNESEDIYVYFVENWMVFLAKLLDGLGVPQEYSPTMAFEDPGSLKGKSGKCMIKVKNSIEWGDQNELEFIKAQPKGIYVEPIQEEWKDSDIPF